MAANDNEVTELVKVLQKQRGLVIGRKGKTIKEIQEKSGVKKIEMKDDGVHLRGTQQQIEKARRMILLITETKECKEKDVTFDSKFSNFLIGSKGATIRKIQNETSTKIQIDKFTGVAHIMGPTQEHLSQAEQQILELVSQKQEETVSWVKKDVEFPDGLAGFLIGPEGQTIRRIKDETGTKIWIDGDQSVAQIKGPTQKHIQDAEQRIQTLISENRAKRNAHSHQYRHKPDRFALVDSTCVGEDNSFKLQEINTDDPKKISYKLIMEGDKTEEKEMDYINELKEALLKVLRKIHENFDDIGNIRTDMWCHFGHVHIHSVDEAEAGTTFELEEINKNLQEAEKNSPWKVSFEAGVEKLEYEALEDELKKREHKVKPNTRFDYTFTSPTEHQIRFKAFVPDTNGEDGCFSFQDDIIPVKNTLTDQSSYYKYRLCAPSSTHLKVDILIPYLMFDCHLVLRTTMREVKDVSQQEEDRILIHFLDENLKYENGNITLPLDKLPSGFSVKYRRQAERRSYPYQMDGSDFNVMISEEESQEESRDGCSIKDEVRTKTDIHVHSDEWDELLDQEDWEPEAIVSKLPAFLKFLRAVQQNIDVPSAEVDE